MLEGRLCPLDRGALLLEPTQRLLLCQAFPLERSPGLGEGSPLLLKLGLRLQVRGSSAAASAAALSAKLILSPSASLAFSSA
jgi:hypothetical protein